MKTNQKNNMPSRLNVHNGLDKWIELALLLVLPMLMFLLTGIGAYWSSKHLEFSVATGLIAFVVGAFISVVIKLIIRIDIYTLPSYIFLICYFTFMLFFYLICQALPILLPLIGLLSAVCWKRRCLHTGKYKSSIPFEQFRVSLFTAVFTGLFTMLSFLILLTGVQPIGWLRFFVPILMPLQLPVYILVMTTFSALMAYIQFKLSKLAF
ncbi:MAG TPA: hypothetical protein DD409_07605 [Bacteroidales bacterium]|nr:hypothetical protein [Bacteroidales bacterium]